MNLSCPLRAFQILFFGTLQITPCFTFQASMLDHECWMESERKNDWKGFCMRFHPGPTSIHPFHLGFLDLGPGGYIPRVETKGKGMLEVPWLVVELREWFASRRSTSLNPFIFLDSPNLISDVNHLTDITDSRVNDWQTTSEWNACCNWFLRDGW